MNNRRQQKFDKSIHDSAKAIRETKSQKEKEYFLKMLPRWERRAGIIANMLETGQANGKDLSLDILTQLNFDLKVLNEKIKRSR